MADQVINFKYKFSDTYNPTYVNGAHGGISPQGEIILNFYLERQSLPQQQTFKVNDDKIGEELISEAIPSDFRNSFVRYIETGITMNLKTAKEIKVWLDQQIEILEGISKQQE